MVEQSQKVPFTAENAAKCVCGQCPVQTGSACVQEKLRTAKGRDLPVLYCAMGVATCTDIDTT